MLRFVLLGPERVVGKPHLIGLGKVFSSYARGRRQKSLLILARRAETDVVRFTNPSPTGSAAAYLAFLILAPLRSRASDVMLRSVPSVRLFASLPMFLAGCQAYRGFRFCNVFALFNGILGCCGRGFRNIHFVVDSG
jgi:hypothetical protein